MMALACHQCLGTIFGQHLYFYTSNCASICTFVSTCVPSVPALLAHQYLLYQFACFTSTKELCKRIQKQHFCVPWAPCGKPLPLKVLLLDSFVEFFCTSKASKLVACHEHLGTIFVSTFALVKQVNWSSSFVLVKQEIHRKQVALAYTN